MNKIKSTIKKAALVFAMVGLVGFLIVALTKTAYPDPLFVWLTRISLPAVFISLGLYVVYWLMELVDLAKRKEWGLVAGQLLIGVLICIFIFRKIR